jgi:ABC-2 type transport system permease protein
MVSSYSMLFLTFALTMVALYGLGMMLSSVFLLLNREAWHLSNLAQEPVYLASGFYFPIRNFGFWLALGASILPMTLGLDAMRQLVFPVGSSFGFLDVRIELAILAVMGVVFLICARYLLAYMERLAIREGRLTDRTR